MIGNAPPREDGGPEHAQQPCRRYSSEGAVALRIRSASSDHLAGLRPTPDSRASAWRRSREGLLVLG
jgi:hypothetical protein